MSDHIHEIAARITKDPNVLLEKKSIKKGSIDESVDRASLAKVAQALNSGKLGQQIKPYDLWLAMGKKRRVPREVIQSRAGMTPEQLVQKAIDDLQGMDFSRKDIVIRILKSAIQ